MSPSGDGCRVFFALWPDEPLRRQIEQRTRAAVLECAGRPIPPCNYHITLLFMGHVAAAALEKVQAMSAALSSPSFELTLDRIQSPARAQVMWLAAKQSPAELVALVQALRSSGLASANEHAFKPHVTLVRNPARRPALLSIEPLLWPVRDFVLVRSQPGVAGSQYTVIGRWTLL